MKYTNEEELKGTTARMIVIAGHLTTSQVFQEIFALDPFDISEISEKPGPSKKY